MNSFGSIIIMIIFVAIGGSAILAFFVGFPWAIVDKIVEHKQIKNGTYDPDEPLWFMKEKKGKA